MLQPEMQEENTCQYSEQKEGEEAFLRPEVLRGVEEGKVKVVGAMIRNITIEADEGHWIFKVPAWARKKQLILFAGFECIADFRPHRTTEPELMVKTRRCNKCGKCCMKLKDKEFILFNYEEFTDKKTGNCKHLTKYKGEYYCSLGFLRPFLCCSRVIASGWKGCSVRYREVKMVT